MQIEMYNWWIYILKQIEYKRKYYYYSSSPGHVNMFDTKTLVGSFAFIDTLNNNYK